MNDKFKKLYGGDRFRWAFIPEGYPHREIDSQLYMLCEKFINTGSKDDFDKIIKLLYNGLERDGITMLWIQSLDLMVLLLMQLGKKGLLNLIKDLQNKANKEYIKFNLQNEQVEDILTHFEIDFKKSIIPENYKKYYGIIGRDLYLPEDAECVFLVKRYYSKLIN